MQTIQIQTTQNVGIQYAVAGLGERIGAFLLDAVLVAAYMIIMSLILDSLSINVIWLQILLYLPAFFYHLICETLFDGQSIGKRQLGIKVVRLDGKPVTFGNYILRWMLRIIDISLTSGAAALLSIAVTKEGQRLGDLAAGTTVIQLKTRQQVDSHQIIERMDPDYEPVFMQASRLAPKDIELIRQALASYKATGNAKPIVAIVKKLKEHLEIESDQPPVSLLYTILKDYSFLNSR
ncbi:MAG: RDD family protein [Cyclobacteriaceae bacterium]